MEGNDWIIFVAALVPMITGFIWYNPKIFGTAWMKAAKVTEEDVQSGNMPVIFILSYVFAVLLAWMMNYLVHHDIQLAGLMFEDPELAISKDSEFGLLIQEHIIRIQERYSSFGHGVAHGLFYSIGLVLPIMATNAMFERKGFKYILVNWGYWTVTLMLMGGVLGQFY